MLDDNTEDDRKQRRLEQSKLHYAKKRKSGQCGRCAEDASPGLSTCESCRESLYAKLHSKHLILKNEVYAEYGGYCCVCCGETEPLFLTLDHINGDGLADRKANGWGSKLYAAIKKAGFPDGYQVLCSNCNHGRYRNGGVCPHQQDV